MLPRSLLALGILLTVALSTVAVVLAQVGWGDTQSTTGAVRAVFETSTPTDTPTVNPTATDTPTPTPTNSPTPTPTNTPPAPPVGGVAELPDVDPSALEQSHSSGGIEGVVVAGVIAAVAAGAVTLGGMAWYARRHWQR